MVLIEQGEIGGPIPDLQRGVFDPGRFELSGGPVHGGDYLGSGIVGRSLRLKSCFKFFETISQLRHGPPYPPDSQIRGVMMLPTQLRFNLQANCQRMSGTQVEHQDLLSPFQLLFCQTVTLLRQVSSEEHCATCVLPGGLTGIPPGRAHVAQCSSCLLYTSPSPRDLSTSRMPSSA